MELFYSDFSRTRYYTPAQTAARLRVSGDLIRRYCRSGRIPAKRTRQGGYLVTQRVVGILTRAVQAKVEGVTLAAIIESVQAELRPVKPKPKATNEPKPEATNEPAIG